MAHHRATRAEINLQAFRQNIQTIRTFLDSSIQIMAVVKADAYGHGMPQTVARLMQSGADAFAVANVYEAAELREIGRPVEPPRLDGPALSIRAALSGSPAKGVLSKCRTWPARMRVVVMRLCPMLQPDRRKPSPAPGQGKSASAIYGLAMPHGIV